MEEAVAAILRRMMKQHIPKKDIPTLPSRRLKVLAAVAHILNHREQYLDEKNCLRTSYAKVLSSLTGCSPYEALSMSSASKDLGLHVSHKSPKGQPGIPGTYWIVEIVIPPKRKTMLLADTVKIVRDAYEGVIEKEGIPGLSSTAAQVAAAVGYILRNSETYVDAQGRVNRPYPELLEELTGRKGDAGTLLTSSRARGLHRRAPAIMGCPSPTVRKPVILTSLAELEKRAGMVIEEPAPDEAAGTIAHEVAEDRLAVQPLEIAENGLRAIHAAGGEEALRIAYLLLRGRQL